MQRAPDSRIGMVLLVEDMLHVPHGVHTMHREGLGMVEQLEGFKAEICYVFVYMGEDRHVHIGVWKVGVTRIRTREDEDTDRDFRTG